MKNVFTVKEYEKIKARCKYDEDNHIWKVPVFQLKENDIAFPKLGGLGAQKEFVKEQKKGRKLQFVGG